MGLFFRKLSYYALRFCLFPYWFMYPATLVNKKRIKETKGQAVIFLANHLSHVDIAYLTLRIRRYQRYIAKKETRERGPLKYWLRSIGTFFVDRDQPGLEFYKDTTKWLQSGGALTLFPEGTRNKTRTPEEMSEVKPGVAMLGIKTNCFIVPMFISKRPKRFRRNHIYVGEPFKFEFEKATKENIAAGTEIVVQKFNELMVVAAEGNARRKNKKKVEAQ